MEAVHHFFTRLQEETFYLRSIFYLVLPSETSPTKFQRDYPPFNEVTYSYIAAFITIEIILCILLKRNDYDTRDTVTSLSTRFLVLIPGMFMGGSQIAAYFYIHHNYAIYSPDVSPLWLWFVTIVGIDFCYYWFHRCAHEINFMWAFHQTHHSSEYFNLVTTLRFPIIADFFVYTFFLPLAFFIPPPIFICHSRINGYYQFWIHAAFTRDLGPIEWIFNTPRHHRVHHGRNPYCIDKNYGGLFILWDRIFGTFHTLKNEEEEKIKYGLVRSIKTFDFIYLEFGAFSEVIQKVVKEVRSAKFPATERAKNAFKACFYGPGWSNKKPYLRLGDRNDLPPVKPDQMPYNPPMPIWQTIYCATHLGIVALLVLIAFPIPIIYQNFYIVVSSYIVSCCSFGYIFNQKSFAPYLECLRCISISFFLWLHGPIIKKVQSIPVIDGIIICYCLSSFLWVFSVIKSQYKKANKSDQISLNIV